MQQTGNSCATFQGLLAQCSSLSCTEVSVGRKLMLDTPEVGEIHGSSVFVLP